MTVAARRHVVIKSSDEPLLLRPRGTLSPPLTSGSVRAWLFILKGVPDHIRSDNGPEMTAAAVREWLGKVGVKTLYI